jgi:hypothetical protein
MTYSNSDPGACCVKRHRWSGFLTGTRVPVLPGRTHIVHIATEIVLKLQIRLHIRPISSYVSTFT